MLQTARNHNCRLLPTSIRSDLPSYDAVYFNVSKKHAASTSKAEVYFKMAAVFLSYPFVITYQTIRCHEVLTAAGTSNSVQ